MVEAVSGGVFHLADVFRVDALARPRAGEFQLDYPPALLFPMPPNRNRSAVRLEQVTHSRRAVEVSPGQCSILIVKCCKARV